MLRGAQPPHIDFAPPNELEARAADGDGAARDQLALYRRFHELDGRVRSALAVEAVDVPLPDGSALALDAAEKQLARKEESRAHRPLRKAIDDALSPFRHFDNYRIETAPAEQRERWRTFLADTRALRDAAGGALASLGGEPPEDAATLGRALDLPDEHGMFGADHTLSLLHVARAAARPVRAPARFRAPRALAGASFVVDGVARFAWAPLLLRFDRHIRTLEAGAAALVSSLKPAAAAPGDVAIALSLALASTAGRRSAGASRGDAERAGRITAAASLLRARAAAATAALEHVDEARDALADAFGCDPGPALVARWLAPAWARLDDGRAARADAGVDAASRALALRDAFDETWPTRREAWQAVAAGAVVVDPASSRAGAWTAWAGASL